jgi:epoxyqueuosine reductase
MLEQHLCDPAHPAEGRILTTVDLATLEELDGIGVGVARAEAYEACEAAIVERRERGLFGDLRFTLTNTARSCHPERLVRGARAVIAAALPLWRPASARPDGLVGRMPRYAWHDPYAPLRARLETLAARLRAEQGARATVFVDSNHHVDREAAIRAGLAFSGKNTMAIIPGQGSFVALGAVVTDLELDPAEQLVPPGCGSCTLCLDACPTGALVEPGVLDTRACISSSTQQPGPIPEAHADALEDRVYGCDICQDVCPWNSGPAARRSALEPDPAAWVSLREWLELADDALLERHGHLYVPKRDPRYLRRNALIALGNAGGGEARALAEPFARGGDPVLAPAAQRVLDRS